MSGGEARTFLRPLAECTLAQLRAVALDPREPMLRRVLAGWGFNRAQDARVEVVNEDPA